MTGNTALTRDEAVALLTAPGQPYETASVPTARGPMRVFVHAPDTLRDLYESTCTDAPFLVHDDERLTFREAWGVASAIGHHLVHDLGVRPGDRVAISMRNSPEWMLAFCAATSVGAVVVAMNSLWTADEMEYGLVDSGATVLFADAERTAMAATLATSGSVTVVPVRTGDDTDLAARIAPYAGRPMPAQAPAADDLSIILYTSGSTGRPKGVVSTHRAVVSALLMWELEARQQALRAPAPAPAAGVTPPQPTALLAVPLFHVLGMHAVYLASYRAQRRLVCMRKWDPAVAAELIERERVTAFSGPPAITGDLVREAKRTNRDLSSLASVGGGGAARAPEQVRQIDASFRNATPGTGWGMTETNAVGTIINGSEYLARPMSSGRCLELLEVRVVGDDGAVLPAGERGELQIRGTSMFVEYWNRPDATADSFVDGWFRTGDVAYLDDDGFLFIVDRIKDLIIRGGENIGCGQVEAALLAHPEVLEAAVYAVPDERLGEEVAATLHGTDDLDLDELRTFLDAHLARYEVPRHLFVSAVPLPRTGSGKVFKRQLRDQAVATLASPTQGA